MFKKIVIAVALIGLVFTQTPAQGPGNNQNGTGPGSQNGMGPGQASGWQNNSGPGRRNGIRMGSNFNGGMTALLMNLPMEGVNTEEEAGLVFMREEEKLARDVYLKLAETWNLPIFSNIARSEQRHMEAVKVILEKYNLYDPVSADTTGVFFNPDLQALYYQLIEKGQESLASALWVGATIEDLDIYDLKHHLSGTDNTDIKVLYQNLIKGSRNHLRSFSSLISRSGAQYTAQYLSQQEVDDILNSPMERGVVDENGDPYYGGTGW